MEPSKVWILWAALLMLPQAKRHVKVLLLGYVVVSTKGLQGLKHLYKILIHYGP